MEDKELKTLQLKVHGIEIIEFLDAIFENNYHFRAIRKSSGASGFGSGQNRNEGLIKAIAELIERESFHRESCASTQKSSSGYAAHTIQSKAAENAISEVIERDALLLMWISGRSPAWLSEDDILNLTPTVAEKLPTFKKNGFSVRLGIIAKTGSHFTCVGTLHPLKKLEFGFVLSSACNKSIANALNSILLDLQRSATVIISRRRLGKEQFTEMEEHDVRSPSDHIEFYMNPRRTPHLSWFWQENEAILDLPTFEYGITYITAPLDIGTPLHVACAHSSDVQSYFSGSTRAELINSERFNRCSLKTSNFSLHPLG